MFTLKDGIAMKRSTLDKIAVPARKGIVSDRWRGIQHGELADTIIERAEAMGLRVKSERWATLMDGAGLIGTLDIAPTPSLKISLPPGVGLSLGIRHSNNGRYALTFLAGARVFVCSNGMISEIFTPADRRKHTTGVVLSDTIDEGLKHFAEGARTVLGREIGALQGMHLDSKDDLKAHHLLVLAGQRGLCPWSQLGKVEKLWRTPPHPEFKARNAWSFYNAFTEVAKEFSPACQIETIHGVRGLLQESARAGLFRNN
jgi:hypothetical protein